MRNRNRPFVTFRKVWFFLTFHAQRVSIIEMDIFLSILAIFGKKTPISMCNNINTLMTINVVTFLVNAGKGTQKL